mgnify:CR=1 FL=1|jgi:hypothetical protein
MIQTVLLIIVLQAIVISITGCSQTAPDSVKAGQLVCQPKDSKLCIGWKYDL